MSEQRDPPLVVTIGGGGSYALGFSLGVNEGLLEEGIDLRRAAIVGTSGGSHAAVAIAGELSFDHVAVIWAEYVASVGVLWGKAGPLAEQLYGSLEVSDVAGVAVRLRWFRRVLLWAPEVRAADLVAASSSPFPFVRPHKIGSRRYIDGGHRSGTSADIVPPAAVQLVIAPFSDRAQGLLGKMGARQVAKETRKWSEATGGRTIVVGPTADMCAVTVKGMRAMGDMTIGRTIRDLAVPVGRDLAATLRRDHPGVVAHLAGDD
jgi:hypothetical protein